MITFQNNIATNIFKVLSSPKDNKYNIAPWDYLIANDE